MEPQHSGSKSWLLNSHIGGVFMSLQRQRRPQQQQLDDLARQGPPCNGVSVPVCVCVPVVLTAQDAAAGSCKGAGDNIMWTLGDTSMLQLLSGDERLDIALSDQVGSLHCPGGCVRVSPAAGGGVLVMSPAAGGGVLVMSPAAGGVAVLVMLQPVAGGPTWAGGRCGDVCQWDVCQGEGLSVASAAGPLCVQGRHVEPWLPAAATGPAADLWWPLAQQLPVPPVMLASLLAAAAAWAC
jgi:hypothetical protein